MCNIGKEINFCIVNFALLIDFQCRYLAFTFLANGQVIIPENRENNSTYNNCIDQIGPNCSPERRQYVNF
ncbi:hypothetical protein D3C80_817280 [compost metagenome]